MTDLEQHQVNRLANFFPDVMSGEMPISIFADAVEEAGLECADWIRRLGVQLIRGKWILVQHDEGYDSWSPLTRKDAPVTFGNNAHYFVFSTEAEALVGLRKIAVAQVRPFVEWIILISDKVSQIAP